MFAYVYIYDNNNNSRTSSISACTSACSAAFPSSAEANWLSNSAIALRAVVSSSASLAALGRALLRASALETTYKKGGVL